MNLIDRLAGALDAYTAPGGPLQTYLDGQRQVEQADYYAQAYRCSLDAGFDHERAHRNASVATARHFAEPPAEERDDAADQTVEEDADDHGDDADVDAA